jgi:hypothetical protein
VFDEESEKNNVLDGWDLLKLGASPDAKKLLGDVPAFRNDKTVLPLQAADLFAYWVRKWELDLMAGNPDEPKYPWRDGVVAVRDDLEGKTPWLRIWFREGDFRKEVAGWLTPEALERHQLKELLLKLRKVQVEG